MTFSVQDPPSIPLPSTPSYMIPGSRDLLGSCHWVSGELQRSGLTCLLFVVCLFVCLLFVVMCLLYSMCIEQVDQYYKQHIQSGRREPPHFINYMVTPLLSPSPVTLERVEGSLKPSFSSCLVGRQSDCLPWRWKTVVIPYFLVERWFCSHLYCVQIAKQFKLDREVNTSPLMCWWPSSILYHTDCHR